MADKREKNRLKRLLEAMKRQRGYLPKAWEYAAENDMGFMEVYNNFTAKGLNAGRALPIKTKELIVIALLAFRGKEDAVREHIKRALKHGATKMEILEALETSAVPGGAPTFSTGLQALMRVEEEEKGIKR